MLAAEASWAPWCARFVPIERGGGCRAVDCSACGHRLGRPWELGTQHQAAAVVAGDKQPEEEEDGETAAMRERLLRYCEALVRETAAAQHTLESWLLNDTEHAAAGIAAARRSVRRAVRHCYLQ